MSKEKAETITNGRKTTNENISNDFFVTAEYSEFIKGETPLIDIYADVASEILRLTYSQCA